VPLPSPKRFSEALMGKRRHRKSRVGDAQPAFFLSKDDRGRFDSLAFCLARRHGSRTINAVIEDQCVNSTHIHIGKVAFLKSKWDFTDASYLKAISTYLLDSSVESPG
jgi:hypothetical protein